MTEQNTEADTAGPDVGSSDTEGVAQIDTPDGVTFRM